MKLPRYVHAFVDRHGKPRYYLRRPGFKRVPLPSLPYSPEFMEAHAAAMAGVAIKQQIGAGKTKPGTINAVIVAYYSHPMFTEQLGPATRANRRAILERLRADHGDNRVAMLRRNHVARMLGRLKPFAARNWLKTLRHLMEFAVLEGYRQDNPTAGIKRAKAPKSEGIHDWTDAEVARFQTRHPVGTMARLAQELLLGTVQRRADAIRIGRQHIRQTKDGPALSVRQRKTREELLLPFDKMPDLLAAIAAMPPTNTLTFLVTERGQPFSDAGFGNKFREWCNEAGLTQCSAHGLRKAGCRRLAEAGCTVHEIAAVSGHLSLSEVQRYTKAVDRARLARAAMARLRAEQKGTGVGKPKQRFAKTGD